MREKRKVNIVGKFSYALTIPKEIVQQLDVRPEDVFWAKANKKKKAIIFYKIEG